MKARLVTPYTPPPAPVKPGTSRGNAASHTQTSVAATPKPPAGNNGFQGQLEQALKSDNPSIREDAQRRFLSRSIRRTSPGVSINGSVSEEQLFAGMVGLKVLVEAGRDAYLHYTDRVRLLSGSVMSGQSHEAAAKMALQELLSEKVISKKTMDSIYSSSFAAAQIDNNENALFDAIGGRRDQTISVATFQQALDKGSARLTQIDIGELKAPIRSITDKPVAKVR